MRPAPCAEAIKKDHNVRSPKADAHAHPSWVPRANKSIDPEANKCQRRQPAKRFVADAGVHERDERNNQPDRERMSHGDRWERTPNCRTLPLLQTQGDCKEPAHPRINAVKGAKAEQRQPRPGTAHG